MRHGGGELLPNCAGGDADAEPGALNGGDVLAAYGELGSGDVEGETELFHGEALPPAYGEVALGADPAPLKGEALLPAYGEFALGAEYAEPVEFHGEAEPAPVLALGPLEAAPGVPQSGAADGPLPPETALHEGAVFVAAVGEAVGAVAPAGGVPAAALFGVPSPDFFGTGLRGPAKKSGSGGPSSSSGWAALAAGFDVSSAA